MACVKWKLRGAFFTPGDPQIIVPGTSRRPNNTPRARGDQFGSFREKSAKSQPNPTQIPKCFDPFLTRWLDSVPVRRSASKFPAQGAGQNSIWTHMEPNQYKNHVLGKCGFCQEALPCRPSRIPGFCRTENHVLRGRVPPALFFSRKNATPRFWTCRPGQIFRDS